MTLDSASESIAHFIGAFQILVEEARLRALYEAFEEGRPELSLGPVTLTMPPAAPDFELEPYSPVVSDALPAPALRDLSLPVPETEPVAHQSPVPPSWFAPAGAAGGALTHTAGRDIPIGELPPPIGVVAVTLQTNILLDNDIYDTDPAIAAAWVARAEATLDAALSRLEGLGAGLTLSPDMPLDPTPLAQQGMDLIAGARSIFAAAEAAPLRVGLPNEGETVLVNGVWQSEYLAWADIIGAEEPEDGAPIEVETGGNTALNEAGGAFGWVDAPVIAALGDVYAVDGIVQINMLRDHDVGLAGASGAAAFIQNSATITGHATEAAPAFPLYGWSVQGVAVATIEADLFCYNWMEQTNFISDADTVTIARAGNELLLQTGGNLTVNTNLLTVLGQQYDLIYCDGDFITYNWITQSNLLVDDDALALTAPPPKAAPGGETPVRSGTGAIEAGPGNRLVNEAAIHGAGDRLSKMDAKLEKALSDGDMAALAELGLPASDGLLKVLHVKGDIAMVNHLKQTNVVLDSDFVTGFADRIEAENNLLGNYANLFAAGSASAVLAKGGIYTDAMIYQAGLVDSSAPATGVMTAQGGDLAAAAVAFLADDVLEPPVKDLGPADAFIGDSHPVSADPMQTILV